MAALEARVEETGGGRASEREHIDALNDLAFELRFQQVSRASDLASQARERAIAAGYKRGQAYAARTMAMTSVAQQGMRVPFELLEEAKRLFDEEGDDAGRAGARDGLATVYEVMGDFPAALSCALEALEIARAIGDPARQGYALSSAGGILAATGDVDGGVERLREGLELFEGAGHLTGIGRICMRLSSVLNGAGRPEQAWAYATRCLEVGRQADNRFLVADGLGAQGEAALLRGDSEQAEALLRQAMEAFPPEARESFSYRTQLRLGDLLLQRGALQEAEQELRDALTRIDVLGVSPADAASAHELLSQVREQQGALAEALAHSREVQRLREEAAQLEARDRVAQVEARAEIEAAKKDAEIHRLRFVELHAMQSQLVEAEKMALLGKLAAGTAHELNNPLGALRGSLGVLQSAVERLAAAGEGERGARIQRAVGASLQTSEQAIARIAEIVESFKRFTQLDQAEERRFNVVEGLEAALALIEPTVPEGVTLERQLRPVPDIHGGPRELNHAFMTILQNAVQAIDGPGSVRVATAHADGRVLVRISDTGRGMDAQELAALFDVGFSESGARTKMRLGLSAAYAAVKAHGGTLEYESEPGAGTVATVGVPVT